MKLDALRQVRAAAARIERATKARDDAIYQAALLGASLREIAKAAGLTHETVRTIVRRKGGEDNA